MALTPEQVTALDAPLDPKRISQRTDKGRALDYLETYDVIDAANRIFGYDGWGYRVLSLVEITNGTYWTTATKDMPSKEKPWALFEATVEAWLVDDWGAEGCRRRDVGHGIARPADSVDTLEMQRKGAVSDALKRALRAFGNQFGNSLYDKDHAKPGRAGTQGAQGSAPRPLEPANAASKPQKDTIARLLHQIDDLQAMEFCEDYNIGIQMKTDGQHYGAGIEAAGLTGGQHGTASQLIDELLPLVKKVAKGAPPPREMPDPRAAQCGDGPAGAEPDAPRDASATKTARPAPDDDIKTAGDLFTYCWKEYQMQRGEVFKVLGVEKVAEIVNPAAALKIVRHAKAKTAEPEQAALMEGE